MYYVLEINPTTGEERTLGRYHLYDSAFRLVSLLVEVREDLNLSYSVRVL